jgi:hypothetical protein
MIKALYRKHNQQDTQDIDNINKLTRLITDWRDSSLSLVSGPDKPSKPSRLITESLVFRFLPETLERVVGVLAGSATDVTSAGFSFLTTLDLISAKENLAAVLGKAT